MSLQGSFLHSDIIRVNVNTITVLEENRLRRSVEDETAYKIEAL